MRESIRAENCIAFDSRGYKTKEEFWQDVGKTLEVLTRQNYMCSFRYEDVGIYILEFDYDNPEFGGPMIYWLDSDQVDCLYTSRYISEDWNDDDKD